MIDPIPCLLDLLLNRLLSLPTPPIFNSENMIDDFQRLFLRISHSKTFDSKNKERDR